ncbi:MAG TPA: glycolate oxidase subunit GlcF [Rhizomicrobium sp.]|nr:glycolate oxidase subunit GlcF [Rhizomicrobium sp.]
MRTNLAPHQLDDPHLASVEKNLRACVHCGICTATCPTYVLTGDERDGPRGRIVMMQRMLEAGETPTAETVFHIDRCLSCLGCRSACPSSVDYARLVDTARAYIQENYRRPWHERLLRTTIAFVMARPRLVKIAFGLARTFAPIATRLPGRLGVMGRKAANIPAHIDNEAAPIEKGARRVALMPGCVQQALAPEIDRAAARVLARRDIALVPLDGAGCCGALAHHLGRADEAKTWARRAIEAFEKAGAVDAVLITATGCAAHLVDYPHLFLDEPEWRKRAQAFADEVKDFSELAAPGTLRIPQPLRVALQVPCSLQHGLRRAGGAAAALEAAGYEICDIPEGHLCCGSAGSYSILQPEMSAALRERKLAAIATVEADVVASPNIGCLMHLAGPDAPPVIHPAELIDWAEGGPRPAAISPAKDAAAAAKTG